jgi:hypothetical protein
MLRIGCPGIHILDAGTDADGLLCEHPEEAWRLVTTAPGR